MHSTKFGVVGLKTCINNEWPSLKQEIKSWMKSLQKFTEAMNAALFKLVSMATSEAHPVATTKILIYLL